MADRDGRKTALQLRIEADEKRKRDKADADAALKEFKASFGDDDDDDDDAGDEADAPGPFAASTSKRHFAASSSRRSGPGTLGPGPSEPPGRRPHGLGPPPSQRQALEAASEKTTKSSVSVAKPVLEITCLPSTVTDLQLRLILAKGNLIPDSIRIVDPDDLESTNKETDKKSVSALAFFDSDTSSRDLDTFVSKFSNYYVGLGFYMFVTRSDTNSYSRIPTHSSMKTNPFGAVVYKPPVAPPHYATSQKGPHQGGIAPPESFQPQSNNAQQSSILEPDEPIVVVKIPKDFRQLQLIHEVIERYLAAPDPVEWEAALMSRPEYQNDEQWAWLYDARSTGGVYYRWRIWEFQTGYIYTDQRNKWFKTEEERLHQLIVGPNIPLWREPDHIPFEFCATLEHLVNDPAYESSDLEDNDDDGMPRPKHWELYADRPDFLNNYEAAKLYNLFEKLPKAQAQLTRGDVMAICDFAIDHAGFGSWQIVERVVENVQWPFNVRRYPDGGLSREETRFADNSASQLVGLYVINDIVANCTDPDARNAWRYRPELAAELLKRHVFDLLGSLPRMHKWGRITEDRWRNQVGAVLAFWSDTSAMDAGPLAEMKAEFDKALQKRKEAPKEGEGDKPGGGGGSWTVVGGQAPTEDTPMRDAT